MNTTLEDLQVEESFQTSTAVEQVPLLTTNLQYSLKEVERLKTSLFILKAAILALDWHNSQIQCLTLRTCNVESIMLYVIYYIYNIHALVFTVFVFQCAYVAIVFDPRCLARNFGFRS